LAARTGVNSDHEGVVYFTKLKYRFIVFFRYFSSVFGIHDFGIGILKYLGIGYRPRTRRNRRIMATEPVVLYPFLSTYTFLSFWWHSNFHFQFSFFYVLWAKLPEIKLMILQFSFSAFPTLLDLSLLSKSPSVPVTTLLSHPYPIKLFPYLPCHNPSPFSFPAIPPFLNPAPSWSFMIVCCLPLACVSH